MSATEQRRVLLIALGNTLRRDDGVARRVLDLLPRRAGISSQELLQLTPEVAQGLTGFDLVVFIDADIQTREPRIEPVGQIHMHSALTHGGNPASIVALAAQLFGFNGAALICRIPAEDFSAGEGLSERAAGAAAAAAQKLGSLLKHQDFGFRFNSVNSAPTSPK